MVPWFSQPCSGYHPYQAKPPTPTSAALLSSAGDLLVPGKTTYKAGEFCRAGIFHGEDWWDKKMEEAVAVKCTSCKSETSLSLYIVRRLHPIKGK